MLSVISLIANTLIRLIRGDCLVSTDKVTRLYYLLYCPKRVLLEPMAAYYPTTSLGLTGQTGIPGPSVGGLRASPVPPEVSSGVNLGPKPGEFKTAPSAGPIVTPEAPAQPIKTLAELAQYANFLQGATETDEHIIRAIGLLLNANTAKYIARPFLIGRNQVVVYGQPAVMMTRSYVIARLGYDPEGLARDVIPLAENMVLTTDNAAGFLYVWLYINGMLDTFAPDEPFDFPLKDRLWQADWMRYFDLDQRSELLNILQMDMARAAAERAKAINEKKAPSLTETERRLLEREAKSWAAQILANPEGAGRLYNVRQYLQPIMEVLGLPYTEDLAFASRMINRREISEFLVNKINLGQRLNPTEHKWGIRWFENIALPEWRKQRYPNEAWELAKIADQLGIPIPRDLAEVIRNTYYPASHFTSSEQLPPPVAEGLGEYVSPERWSRWAIDNPLAWWPRETRAAPSTAPALPSGLPVVPTGYSPASLAEIQPPSYSGGLAGVGSAAPSGWTGSPGTQSIYYTGSLGSQSR